MLPSLERNPRDKLATGVFVVDVTFDHTGQDGLAIHRQHHIDGGKGEPGGFGCGTKLFRSNFTAPASASSHRRLALRCARRCRGSASTAPARAGYEWLAFGSAGRRSLRIALATATRSTSTRYRLPVRCAGRRCAATAPRASAASDG